MGLKVLLNNNMIYDLENEKDVKKYDMVKNGVQIAYGVKKSSNNILDMIESEDLIELDNEEICHVFGIDDETGGYILMNTDMIIKNSSSITAIYKRQPNGDYKRYEVK